MFPQYDVIVVGAGHAGCEAANAAATLNAKVLLITMNMNTIAQMSCNPAMGGVAKGQIVREIDALGGMSGIITDETMIQFRMLNRSKGPAMWSPRAQSDRMRFSEKWRMVLEANKNIDFWQDSVTSILSSSDKSRIIGVQTSMGHNIYGKSVILTSGTFLNGIIHIGLKKFGGGRMGEKASTGITESLQSLGFTSGRMKTGTPPRIDGRTLNYTIMEVQEGDEPISRFSYLNTVVPEQQKPCFITYTNSETHNILRKGFHESPMFNGDIKGQGPRYCPSIEDKINRFSERDRHQIFVEPEGLNTIEIYVNGFSSSLPENIQYEAIQTIPGFENAKMFRPGYAIEYDYFPPTQLKLSLETQRIENLFFAGQINGTTGYEEAACQGFMAGVNAVLKIREEDPFILSRSDAYIGVLIDDLINKGTEEPYRMFTSRAEYRISLRQDNADQRLTPIGYKLGTVDQKRMDIYLSKQSRVSALQKLMSTKISPSDINHFLNSINESEIAEKTMLSILAKRPHLSLPRLLIELNLFTEEKFTEEEIIQTEIQLKYAPYLERELAMAQKLGQLETVLLSESMNYRQITALSAEAREKLQKQKPQNLGQASRISGITPADLSVLLIHLNRKGVS